MAILHSFVGTGPTPTINQDLLAFVRSSARGGCATVRGEEAGSGRGGRRLADARGKLLPIPRTINVLPMTSWAPALGVRAPGPGFQQAGSPAGCQPSRMKVTSIVMRYSATLPFATLAFISNTCRPVMPRNVLLARSNPSRTAASKLSGDAAVIFDTLATAMFASLQSPDRHSFLASACPPAV
jgi:hypothetical protein